MSKEKVIDLHVTKDIIVQLFIIPINNQPHGSRWKHLAWVGAQCNHLNRNMWICSLWYLINPLEITRRFHCILYINYKTSLLWVSMSTISTLVNSKGMVLVLLSIKKWIGRTH